MPEYSFLSTEPKLAGGIEMLCFGGSCAYGLDTPTSDTDVRGFALPTERDIILGQDFEQVENHSTDTVIYSIAKIISLLQGCNPNIVEILNVDENHIFYKGKAADMLLAHSEYFLSQRAGDTFGGYAEQQLRRIQNNLARYTITAQQKEEHIRNSILSALKTLPEKMKNFEDGMVEVFIDTNEEGLPDIYLNVDMKHYPLRQYNDVMGHLHHIIKEYDKLPERSRKKDSGHLSKHMSHLIRLYYMGTEILNSEGVHTLRTGDNAKLLMDIKQGKYLTQDDNGEFIIKDEFWDIFNELKARFDEAKKTTKLPKAADIKGIEKLRYDINKMILDDGYHGATYEEILESLA